MLLLLQDYGCLFATKAETLVEQVMGLESTLCT